MAGMSKTGLIFLIAIIPLGVMLPGRAIEDIQTPNLDQPGQGTVISGDTITLRWFFIDETQIYWHIQLSYDSSFSMVFYQKDDISHLLNYHEYSGLPQDGITIYWRVRALSMNVFPEIYGDWSTAWSFISALPEGTPSPHPADTNADWRLIMDEVIPYIGGWQQGTNPMAYAIRGASLWQNGEYYAFNSDLSCPLCWVLDSKNGMELKSEPDAALHNVTRSIRDNSVSLMVMPTSGATVWGVEEYVPSELTATGITGSNGAWDTVNRKVSWWGTGDVPVVLGYQVEGADGSYLMQGAANVDGATVDITGDSAVQLGSVSQEGELVSEGEGETVVEDEGELPASAEEETLVEGEASLTDEDAAESAGCCSPQRGKDLIREQLGNWLLFALACLVLVRMGRVG